MKFLQVIWDDDDQPDGNVQHIAEHLPRHRLRSAGTVRKKNHGQEEDH
jgi:hypothetical protein